MLGDQETIRCVCVSVIFREMSSVRLYVAAHPKSMTELSVVHTRKIGWWIWSVQDSRLCSALEKTGMSGSLRSGTDKGGIGIYYGELESGGGFACNNLCYSNRMNLLSLR